MKIVLVTLLFLFTTSITGCSMANAEPDIISQQEAYELITSGADAVILDVRTHAEFSEQHIPNSVLLPLDEIADLALELFDTNTTLLVICRSGNRSQEATKLLAELGFTHVYDIGGIITWPGIIIN